MTCVPGRGGRGPSPSRPNLRPEWIADLARDLSPRTVQAYWQVLAQTFDYAEQTPNPARHKTVKLPYADVEEVTPPSTEHFLAILARLAPRFRLPAVFLEQTGCRVAELRVWEWQDVDVAGCVSAPAG